MALTSTPAGASPIGWPLLPLPDQDGRLQWPSLEESVRQMIQVILLTRAGEQLMHPEFGGGLADFLHEPNTLLTRRRIRDQVVEALTRWEPRLELDGVEVWEVPDRATDVEIEINYRIRRTGAPATLRAALQLGR
ncbi:MAG: GPW/gp25 family protein [Gemmatimonadales bacterium]